MKIVSTRIEDDLNEWLEKKAKTEDRKPASIIRRIIKKAMEKDKNKEDQ